jgi:hypothetical protein
MDMIRGDMPLQDIDTRLLTFLSDNGTHPFCHLTTQHLMAVLGDPDNVEVNRKGCMGTMAIVQGYSVFGEGLQIKPKTS